MLASRTRISLDPETVSTLARVALGARAVSADTFADGWFNAVYRVGLDDGRVVVLKLAPPRDVPVLRYERHLLAAEVTVLGTLRALPGVPVPNVLACDASLSVCPVEFFFMDFVPGDNFGGSRPALAEPERNRLDAALGGLLARVNDCRGARFGRAVPDHCTSDGWAGTVIAMVTDLLADARDAGVILPLADDHILAVFEHARAELDAVTEPRLVLWDLHPGNVIVREGEIAAIIDCDRALWGDPLMEFGFRSLAGANTAFSAGYGAHALLERPGARRRVWLYDLYLALVMVIECAYRGYDARHVAWAKRELGRVQGLAAPGWLLA